MSIPYTDSLKFVMKSDDSALWTVSSDLIEEIPSLENTGISATQGTAAGRPKLLNDVVVVEAGEQQCMELPSSIMQVGSVFVVSVRFHVPLFAHGGTSQPPTHLLSTRNDRLGALTVGTDVNNGQLRARVYNNNITKGSFDIDYDTDHVISVVYDPAGTSKILLNDGIIADSSFDDGSTTQTNHIFGSRRDNMLYDVHTKNVFIADSAPSDAELQDIHNWLIAGMPVGISLNPIVDEDGNPVEGCAVEHWAFDNTGKDNGEHLETLYTDINGEVTLTKELDAGKVRMTRAFKVAGDYDNYDETFYSN